MVYKKKTHYNEWEFVYDPLAEQMQAMGAAGGVPVTNGVPGFGGTSSVGGSSSAGGSSSGGSTTGGSTSTP